VVSLDKISIAMKELARITEAVSVWLLWSGGLTGNLVPIAQFDQFEKLDQPVMKVGSEDEAHDLWASLSKERDHYFDDLDTELFGSRA
jgi:hypothetical protein